MLMNRAGVVPDVLIYAVRTLYHVALVCGC